MKIETLPLNTLKPYARNARTHSKRQIKQIAKSIERFGFNNPILIDDDKEIIAGHGRAEAAKLIGMAMVPTVRLSHLSEADKRAYILADNKLAENAGWDREILAIELQALVDVDFDFETIGFENAQIDGILRMPQRAMAAFRGQRTTRRTFRRTPRPGLVISGCWGNTACCAQTHARKPLMTSCLRAPKPSSSLPTHPTTFRSMATSAASGASAMPSSPWRAAR